MKSADFPTGVAGDRVDIVKRDEILSFEAFDEGRSLRTHDGERQVGRGATGGAGFGAGGLQQVALARARWTVNPHGRVRAHGCDSPQRLDGFRVGAGGIGLEAQRYAELDPEWELAHGVRRRRGDRG